MHLSGYGVYQDLGIKPSSPEPRLLRYCSSGWKFSRTICRIPVPPFVYVVNARQPPGPKTATGKGEIMRKVNVLEFVSLDGVIQAPGGPEEDTSGGFAYGGWTSPHSDPVVATAIRKQMNMPFDLLIGRRTFDNFARFWPQHNDI
jgi:hypothetical protein